jgi:formate-dependent nitrite reductase membrane component NrfD
MRTSFSLEPTGDVAMDFWHDAFVPTVVAAIGTAAGATVAFLFERIKREREAENAHITAINTALFALFQIVNDLTVYRRQHIEPVLFENLNHLGCCAFVESQRASEAGFAIDPLIV